MSRLLAALALALAAAALAGCAVVSEEPLFSPATPPAHPMAEGLWAMASPGCEVAPNAAGVLPDCAAPVIIAKGRMDWDGPAFMARLMGQAGAGMAALPMPKTTAFVQADGDPQILELLNGDSNGLPPGGLPGGKPLKPGYLALKVLETDRAGRIVRGVLWPVACPPPGRELPAGMSRIAGRCLAATAAVVRTQSKTPGPFQSVFLIWVSPRTELPGSGGHD
jgi:hypothetical protein